MCLINYLIFKIFSFWLCRIQLPTTIGSPWFQNITIFILTYTIQKQCTFISTNIKSKAFPPTKLSWYNQTVMTINRSNLFIFIWSALPTCSIFRFFFIFTINKKSYIIISTRNWRNISSYILFDRFPFHFLKFWYIFVSVSLTTLTIWIISYSITILIFRIDYCKCLIIITRRCFCNLSSTVNRC